MKEVQFHAVGRREIRSAAEWHTALEAEASRLDFLLRRLPGSAIRAVVGDMSDTGNPAEWRAKLDAAMDRKGVPHGVEAVHEPTGATVVCTHERSQHLNRDAALRGLRAIFGATDGSDLHRPTPKTRSTQ